MTLEVDGQLITPAMEDEARRAVRLATRSAVYAVDSTGVAVEADIRSALDRAATAQARALLFRDEQDATNKASAALSPLGKPLSSASIGGASYTAEQGASAVPEPFQLPGGGRLCAAAHDILFDAGLLYGMVATHG